MNAVPVAQPSWTCHFKGAKEFFSHKQYDEMYLMKIYTRSAITQVNKDWTRCWSSWTSRLQDYGLLAEQPRPAAAKLLEE